MKLEKSDLLGFKFPVRINGGYLVDFGDVIIDRILPDINKVIIDKISKCKTAIEFNDEGTEVWKFKKVGVCEKRAPWPWDI